MEWFEKNDMQAIPDKFHFMLFFPTPTEQQVLQLCGGMSPMFETGVTVLGITVDDKSTNLIKEQNSIFGYMVRLYSLW